MIDCFVSITTKSTLAILLRLINFCFNQVSSYGILFCVANWRDSFFLLRFPFLSQDQVFSWEISLVYRLKYSHNFFSSDFCFQVIVVLLIIMLFLIAVISLFFSSRLIDISTIFSAGVSSSSFFSWQMQPVMSSLGWKALWIVMNFLVLCWSSLKFHFKNSPECLTKGTAQIFISLMRLLLFSLVSSSFLFLLKYSFFVVVFFFFFFFFFFFLFISACLIVSASNITKYL